MDCRGAFLLVLVVVIIGCTDAATKELKKDTFNTTKFLEMVYIKGGEFVFGYQGPPETMQSGEFQARYGRVKAFYMDRYPAPNHLFKKFIRAKRRYSSDAEGFGYSYVFDQVVPREHKSENNTKKLPYDLHMIRVNGADWRHPEGPYSNIKFRNNFPVVHMSWHDARAYCSWMKKRLPSEMEWEFAARGGIMDKRYPWGGRFQKKRANLWQGEFPDENTKEDGYKTLAPVDAYESQNSYGLYDMMGNVWEWTNSMFKESNLPKRYQKERYVLRGTSYIDSHDGKANTVARITARKGLEPFYSSHHVGFRCASDVKSAERFQLRREEL